MAGKFGGEKFGELTLFELLAKEIKVPQINRSALIVSTNLDGFSLANHQQFSKFAKLPPPLPNFPMEQNAL